MHSPVDFRFREQVLHKHFVKVDDGWNSCMYLLAQHAGKSRSVRCRPDLLIRIAPGCWFYQMDAKRIPRENRSWLSNISFVTVTVSWTSLVVQKLVQWIYWSCVQFVNQYKRLSIRSKAPGIFGLAPNNRGEGERICFVRCGLLLILYRQIARYIIVPSVNSCYIHPFLSALLERQNFVSGTI